MSRPWGRYLDDPEVIRLTREIAELQRQRNNRVKRLSFKARYRNNPEVQETYKALARKRYYEVVRPKLYPHLCQEAA